MAWFFDHDNKANKVSIKDLSTRVEDAFASSSFIWVHLDYENTTSSDIVKLLRLGKEAQTTLLSQTTRPRFEPIGNDSYLLVLRGVNLIDPENPHDMISLRCFVSKDIIVTTGRRQLKTITEISQDIETGKKEYANSQELCADIVRILSEKMAPVFNEIEDEIDDFELNNLNNENHANKLAQRKEIKDLRLKTLHLRRYVFPQKDALVQYLDFLYRLSGHMDHFSIKQSVDDHRRYIEDIDLSRERLNLLDQEIVAELSERMNNNLYILSIVSLIFLPLGFLTGLFGINVGGMPMVEDSNGFWIVCGICAILAIIQFIILAKMGWINLSTKSTRDTDQG